MLKGNSGVYMKLSYLVELVTVVITSLVNIFHNNWNKLLQISEKKKQIETLPSLLDMSCVIVATATYNISASSQINIAGFRPVYLISTESQHQWKRL